VLQLVVATVFLAWSVRWFTDGWTDGERAVQRAYLLRVVAAGALSYGAYASVTRAQRDAGWRWVAWLCTGLALLMAVGALL
jgi:hypothetical protein